MFISYETLVNLVTKGLMKAGVSKRQAILLAEHLATADLNGHHSHGVIRLPIYYERIKKGTINPKAKISIIDHSKTIAFIDGQHTFGQLASLKAAEVAIKKAKKMGMAAIGVYNIDHTGRLGAFVEHLAKAEMIGFFYCNGRTGMAMQAPYGGKDAKFSANPFAFAAPRKKACPIVIDMATTAIAHGKVMEALVKKEKVPLGTILDKKGEFSENPEDYFDGGTLLPMGGNQYHKGAALALMVEILAGILSTARGISSKTIQDHNAAFMIALNISHFLPLDSYYEQIDSLVSDLKSSTVRPGFDEIILPGEHANTIIQKQLKEGIYIPDVTYQILL